MIKSSIKISKNDSSNLEKLRKEKELILKEMEERKRLKLMKKSIVEKTKIIPIIENLKIDAKPKIDEKIRKIPKFEVKSFEQIMKEAKEKEEMKNRSSISNLSQNFTKKSNSEIYSREKIKKNEPILKSINSIKKISRVNLITSEKKINNENITKKSINNRDNQEAPCKTIPNNIVKSVKYPPKSVFRSSLPSQNANRGIMAQNVNRGIMAQNSIQCPRQNSFKTPSIPHQPCITGIEAQSNRKAEKRPFSSQQQLNENPAKKNRESNHNDSINKEYTQKSSGISAQSSRGISAQNSRVISAQNSRGNSAQRSRGISAQCSRVISAQSSRDISAQSSRGISAQSSRGISAQSSRGISAQNSRGISAQSSRGISAQNSRNNSAQNSRNNSAQSSRGISAQNSRNNSAQSSRGISTQNNNGILAQSGRGIINQNSYGIAAQNNRGIAAQNSRGIISQNSRGITSQNSMDYMSGSDSEYDSEMDDFIDYSEPYTDDSIRDNIHQILKFDPTKYKKVSAHDNCTDMLASFDVIENEEKRSRVLGKKEDARELQLELEGKLKKQKKL